MAFKEYVSGKLKKITPDIGRVGSAAGIGAGGGIWFANQSEAVRNGFAGSVSWPFGAYGFFEGWNVYKDFQKNRREGENLAKYLWRLSREDPWKLAEYTGKVAPLASPFIGLATNNDFKYTILATFLAHVGGYTVDYLRKTKAKKTVTSAENPIG